MKKTILTLALAVVAMVAVAQTPLKKVYDETVDPMGQIDKALASAGDKYVLCQVGGNWCPWCLRFADFATNDSAVAKVIADNFVYIHTNYNPRKSATADEAKAAEALMSRLGHPARFGFPVFVVLDHKGSVVHIQDSSFLEEGKGYSRDKVLRFLNAWTPRSVEGQR